MNPKWSEEEVLLLKDKYSRLTNDELITLLSTEATEEQAEDSTLPPFMQAEQED